MQILYQSIDQLWILNINHIRNLNQERLYLKAKKMAMEIFALKIFLRWYTACKEFYANSCNQYPKSESTLKYCNLRWNRYFKIRLISQMGNLLFAMKVCAYTNYRLLQFLKLHKFAFLWLERVTLHLIQSKIVCILWYYDRNSRLRIYTELTVHFI